MKAPASMRKGDQPASQNSSSSWQALCDPDHGIATAGTRSPVRPLLLVAHPDDETVGAATFLSRTTDGIVVFCTDGAPIDSKLWSPDAAGGSRESYALMRRQEAYAALHLLGIDGEWVRFLDAVDQDAVFSLSRLIEDFISTLARYRPDIVITHAYEGGHPDHDAASLIARVAINAVESDYRPVLAEMPLYHARDNQYVLAQFLPTLQDGTSGPQELILQLSAEEIARKQQMIGCHRSQRLVLAGFPLECERFRLAPAYNYSESPYPGKLWYECMGWSMTGDRWRELATRALAAKRTTACS